MLSASLYIILCSAKNRVRARLRRLREPRYLVGAIAGVAYLYFAVFMRIGARRATRPGAGPPPELFAGSFQGIATIVAGVVMLVLAALTWVFPSNGAMFEFSAAETNLLFPAPVTRRQLLIHRLMRSQLGFLFASCAAAFVITAPRLSGALGLGSVAARLLRAIAFWVLFVTLRVYSSGVTLARARLTSSDPRMRRIAWTPLVAIAAAVTAVGVPLVRSLSSQPPRSLRQTVARISELTATGAPRIMLAPFVSLVRPFFTDGLGSYLIALVGALAVTAVTIGWVLWSDEAFQNGGDEPAQSREGRSSVPNAPRARVIPWRLRLTGRVETLFLWKNGMQTLRTTDLMTVLPYAFPAVVLAVVGATARMSALGARGPAVGFAVASLLVAAFCALIGPQMMRSDLRGDLIHLDLLKTWPVKASAVIRGQILWPIALLTLFTWGALACGTVFSAPAFPRWTLAWRLSLSALAFVLAPALIAAQFTVHNAAAVLFPAWVPTGRQRPRGLDAMGQRLILFAGVMLSLIVLVGPGAIAGGIVTFAFLRLIGPVILVPAGLVCLAIVAVELALVTEMLGGAYERIDLSQVERSE